MENTLENKQMFFAQYWGLPINNYKLQYSKRLKVVVEPKNAIQKNSYLTLIPLSKISDENAIEAGNIFDGLRLLNSSAKINYTKVWLNQFIEKREISDFLRSKGYALPWMGLSVEQLVEYGWVKLK